MLEVLLLVIGADEELAVFLWNHLCLCIHSNVMLLATFAKGFLNLTLRELIVPWNGRLSLSWPSPCQVNVVEAMLLAAQLQSHGIPFRHALQLPLWCLIFDGLPVFG